jgi:hypothetical protein
MAKFHIDPAGNPGLCRATKRCPYGDIENDHYASEPMARRAYELENETHELTFDDTFKDMFRNIGPRQLPNRSWVTLRNALYDNLFSEHDLGIATTTISEEWKKHSEVLSKPIYQWGAQERESAVVLSSIGRLAAILSQKGERWEKDRKDKLAKEFPSDAK